MGEEHSLNFFHEHTPTRVLHYQDKRGCDEEGWKHGKLLFSLIWFLLSKALFWLNIEGTRHKTQSGISIGKGTLSSAEAVLRLVSLVLRLRRIPFKDLIYLRFKHCGSRYGKRNRDFLLTNFECDALLPRKVLEDFF